MGLFLIFSCPGLFTEMVVCALLSMSSCIEVLGVRGENTTLVCQGKSTTGTINWNRQVRRQGSIVIYARGNKINPNYPRYASVGNHTAGEYNLHIADLRDEDAGEYYCFDPLESKYPLQSLRIIVGVLGVRGENTTLVCQGKSTTGTINWNRQGRHLDSVVVYAIGSRINPEYPLISVVGNRTAGEYNLHIANLRDEDAGEYYCVDPLGPKYPLQSLRIIDPISADHVMSRVSVSSNGLSLSVTAFEIQMLPTLTLRKLGSVNSSSIVAARMARRTGVGTYTVTWTYAESNMAPGVYYYSAAIYPGSYRDVYSAEIPQQGEVTGDNVLCSLVSSGNQLEFSVTVFGIWVRPTLYLHRSGPTDNSVIATNPEYKQNNGSAYIVVWTHRDHNMAPGVYNYTVAIHPGIYRAHHTATISQQSTILEGQRTTIYAVAATFVLMFIHTATVYVFCLCLVFPYAEPSEKMKTYLHLQFWPIGCILYVLDEQRKYGSDRKNRKKCGRHWLALIPVVGSVTIIFMNSKRDKLSRSESPKQ